MTTMRGIHSSQPPCCLQAYGCFQYDVSSVPFYRRSSQPGYSSHKSPVARALASSGLSYDKSDLWSVNLDYGHYRQGRRSRESQFGNRKIGVLQELKSTPSGRVPHSTLDSDSTSTTATDPAQQQQNATSSHTPENFEQGVVGTSSGLSALDAYFSKLKGGTERPQALANASKSTSVSAGMVPFLKQNNAVTGTGSNPPVAAESGSEGKEMEGLKALDAYFEKLNPRKPEPEPEPVPVQEDVKPVTETAAELTDEELFMKSLMEAKEDYEKYRSSVKDKGNSPTGDLKFQVTSNSEMDFSNWELPEEHSTNSNLINVLVAVNIAVYLFGLASPHEAMGITDSSVPVVYGAKVNELMLAGQWWRFITPMFLHASLLHVGLGSWALLSFGPAVESAYGTLGFAMIYFLGGLFGDLTSFFHTTEWTVGGTGPIYALVGTWVVYLLKNREIIGEGIADDMIRKVVILSALNVALCNSLPIDDWTHLGAVLIGTFFGMLASPTMHLNVAVKDASPEEKDEDAAAYLWFNNGTSRERLAVIFAICLGIFFILFQLSIGGSSDFYLLQDNDVFS